MTLNNSSVTVAGSNNLTLAGPVAVSDATPATGSAFTNTPTLTSTGVTTLTGALSGTGNLLLAGAGSGYLNLNGASTVVLGGNGAGYSGTTFLTGPTVVAASNTAFGTGTVALTTGSLLADTAGRTLANNLIANGNVALGGSSVNLANPAVGSGKLTLNANGALPNVVATNAVQTISMTKVASGNFQLSYNGQPTAVIAYSTTPATTSSAIQTALQALPALGANVTVAALGTSGANNQYFTVTFAGTLAATPVPTMTIINSGPLVASANVVRLSVAPTTVGSPGLTVNTGGSVTLDNTGTNNANRLNDSAVVALNGGTLNLLGSNSAATSETIGTVALTGGASTVFTQAGAGQALAFNAMTAVRNTGATVNFVAGGGQTLGSATNQVNITAVPAALLLAGGIVPFATVTDATTVAGNTTGFNLATATGATGASIAAFTGYNASNVLVTGSQVLSGTVNAVLIVGDGVNVSGASLAVTSGVIATAGGNTTGNTVSVSTVSLGAAEGVLTAYANSASAAPAGGNLRFTGSITGGATNPGLTFFGPTTTDSTAAGAVALNSPSSVLNAAAITSLSSGTLVLGNSNVRPAGTLVLNGGTLLAATAVTVTTAVTLTNSAVTIGGSSSIVFTGAVTLGGFNDTPTVTNTAPTFFGGVIQDAATNPARGFTKAGTGTVTLTGANTYTGLTTVAGGTLNVQNNTALGLQATNTVGGNTGSGTTAPVVLAMPSGTLVGTGATLQLQGGITLSEQITLAGGTLENLLGTNTLNTNALISLTAPSTVAVGVNQLNVNSNVVGMADVTKTGGGVLQLVGLNSVYTGQTNITAGTVSVAQANALGATTGTAVVQTGAMLQLRPAGGTTFPGKQLVLNGTGVGLVVSGLLTGPGALQNNLAAANTWTGNVILASADAAVGSIASGSVTLTGSITGAGGLTKVGAGTVAVAGPDSHGGVTTVSVGTLTVNGVGQLTAASGVTVNPGASLTLDNNATLNGTTGFIQSGRVVTSVGAPGTLSLNNATLNFVGSNATGAATADALGTVNLNAGSSFVNQTSGSGLGATATLTVGTLNRASGGTVSFVPGGTAGVNGNFNTPANRFLINTLGTGVAQVNGIVPWATVGTLTPTTPNQYDFVTLSPAGSASSVAAFTNYKSSIAAAGPTDAVRLTANETLAANRVVNAVLFAGTSAGTNPTITQNGFTLGVAAGAILSEGNNVLTVSGGTVDFGAAEGILGQNNANITMNSSLTGTGGLTVYNTTAGNITLAAANTYTGGTTVNATGSGNLTLGNASALGNGAVTLIAGTPNNTVGANFALANPVNFNNSVVTLGGGNRILFVGPITVAGSNQFSVGNAAFLGGMIRDGATPGSINMLSGTALVMLNPNNTYSGGTNLGGGNLQVNASSTGAPGAVTKGPLGTGPTNLTGGVLQNGNTGVADYSVNSVTLHNAVTLINTSTVIGGPATTAAGDGGEMTLAGPVTVGGANNNFGTAVGFGFTISGNISGTGNLNRANNSGGMLLSGNNTFSGGVTVTGVAGVLGNVGNLVVGSGTALGTGIATLNGGTLQDDGRAARTIANTVILATGTTSTINAINPSTPFTFTGPIVGTGSRCGRRHVHRDGRRARPERRAVHRDHGRWRRRVGGADVLEPDTRDRGRGELRRGDRRPPDARRRHEPDLRAAGPGDDPVELRCEGRHGRRPGERELQPPDRHGQRQRVEPVGHDDVHVHGRRRRHGDGHRRDGEHPHHRHADRPRHGDGERDPHPLRRHHAQRHRPDGAGDRHVRGDDRRHDLGDHPELRGDGRRHHRRRRVHAHPVVGADQRVVGRADDRRGRHARPHHGGRQHRDGQLPVRDAEPEHGGGHRRGDGQHARHLRRHDHRERRHADDRQPAGAQHRPGRPDIHRQQRREPERRHLGGRVDRVQPRHRRGHDHLHHRRPEHVHRPDQHHQRDAEPRGDRQRRAWNSAAGAGSLVVIGNGTGAAGTQASLVDNSNNVPNQTNLVVNSTGSFIQTTTGDALGGFLLNGGTVSLAGTTGNLESAITALPSAIPSTITTIAGASIGLARTGVAAGYNVINVFQGAGAALGNELTINGTLTPGTAGSGFTVQKIGAGTLTLSGTAANTFTEPTTVLEGTLVLAKSANVNALTGTLIVGAFGTAATVRTTTNFNNLNTAQPVILNAGGTFDISGSTAIQTASNLDLRGGTLTVGTNTLGVNGTLNALPVSTTGTTIVGNTIAGILALGGNTTINTIDNGAVIGLTIPAVITQTAVSNLTKGGAGTLALTGTAPNTYTGTTTLSTVCCCSTTPAGRRSRATWSAATRSAARGRSRRTSSGSWRTTRSRRSPRCRY